MSSSFEGGPLKPAAAPAVPPLAMDEQQERRRDVRARVSLPTFQVRRGELDEIEMIDASFRGLFLRFARPPQIRELVKLRIDLPTRPLVVHAVVVRIVAAGLGAPPGVGLRFFALNGVERQEWESFVAGVLTRRAGGVRAA